MVLRLNYVWKVGFSLSETFRNFVGIGTEKSKIGLIPVFHLQQLHSSGPKRFFLANRAINPFRYMFQSRIGISPALNMCRV